MAIVFGIALWGAIMGAMVWLFRGVWNIVMPAVFELPEISFWMAAGIVFLLGFVGSLINK